jgi:chemotaxis signal transduction protein
MTVRVDDLIPHMRRVQGAERDLRDLGLLWQMIEASSAISCPEEAESILPMLTQTRVRFADLQRKLVAQLGRAALDELGDELTALAQCTIDILVRNLFERTADVGFLATDDVLRAFCSADRAAREDMHEAFIERLRAYQSKYSVYDDIVLLDTERRVIARLDASRPVEISHDPVVAQALGQRGHAERFGPSDLSRDASPCLLYAHRVEDAQGRLQGALVLRFRHQDEMARIFAGVGRDAPEVALLLLDDGDEVIASSDVSHVALGSHVKGAAHAQVALTTFAGREYLSVTCQTRGYQGYTGPKGWHAQAMVSLLTAFRNRGDDEADPKQLSLDDEGLQLIQQEVDAINADLRRVVWNGRLVAHMQDGAQARLKSVLTQVNGAGTRTRDRVGTAIRELYRSSLHRACRQSRELARLAADVMDRNLYERANDCRWWALSPVLREVLADPDTAPGHPELQRVLSAIQALYAVYSRLVVFDAQGRICGVSDDEATASLLGQTIDDALLQSVRQLNDPQRYAVSPFRESPLSGGQATYIYAAAIRAPDGARIVGGIAVVFNAQREFRAMLDDVKGELDGLAAFVDSAGRVLSCTDERFPVGSVLPFRADGVVDHEEVHYASARIRAPGYREFKRQDGYDNGVHAVFAVRLGSLDRRRIAHHDIALQALVSRHRDELQEYALFHVGAGRYALPAACVVEARTREGLVIAPLGNAAMAGLLEVPDGRATRVVPVLCGRRFFGLNYPPRTGDGVVLVLADPSQPGRPIAGFLVDHVSTVLDVGPEHLQAAPEGLRLHAPALKALLRVEAFSARGREPDLLVQLIDAQVLLDRVAPLRAPLRVAA